MTINGILPLFKPKGMTSHDCVFKLRKILHTKKVGHTGTLDPDVTGVLPICIGRATKIAEYMTAYPKTYEAEVAIGYSTTTEDRSGELVEQAAVDRVITRADVESVLQSFLGDRMQVPPMYSAVKVNGKKLYQYAREGKEVERPRRSITVYDIKLLSDEVRVVGDEVRFRFHVKCSKGTYVRTLAVDIGKALGFPAHMSDLTRVASGPFMVEDCLTFAEVENYMETGTIAKHCLTIEEALVDIKKVTVDADIAAQIKNGAVLPLFEGVKEQRLGLYNQAGQCLAIYQKHPTKAGLMKPEKMLKID